MEKSSNFVSFLWMFIQYNLFFHYVYKILQTTFLPFYVNVNVKIIDLEGGGDADGLVWGVGGWGGTPDDWYLDLDGTN
jgi:hypothetical protein